MLFSFLSEWKQFKRDDCVASGQRFHPQKIPACSMGSELLQVSPLNMDRVCLLALILQAWQLGVASKLPHQRTIHFLLDLKLESWQFSCVLLFRFPFDGVWEGHAAFGLRVTRQFDLSEASLVFLLCLCDVTTAAAKGFLHEANSAVLYVEGNKHMDLQKYVSFFILFTSC